MKKYLLLLLISITFAGCSLEEENVRNVVYKMVPVESVIVPEEFVQGEEYTIVMNYRLPTNCHSFYGTEYELDQSTAYFGILTAYTERQECQDISSEIIQASFQFTATRSEKYTFKFWKGVDEEGNVLYLTKEIPVISFSETK